MAMDQDDVDLLIVMGSSLKVGPVNDIPDAIDDSVPRILSKLVTLLLLYPFLSVITICFSQQRTIASHA